VINIDKNSYFSGLENFGKINKSFGKVMEILQNNYIIEYV